MEKSKKRKKVLIALSGGIDSAVSAHLLIKQGYQVEAAFMKNWSSTAGLLRSQCPWLEDRQDALRVAAFLAMPMHTLDFEKQYQNTVMKYFFKEYKAGRTPNPDVMCNKEIKFKLLYNWAMKNGFDFLATGHYAKVGNSEQAIGKRQLLPNRYSLLRSSDEFKDQTYFIYNIKTEQLPHILFPIGGMKKTAVRSLARKIGLPNAEKKESMGLCFVGKIRLKDFLKQKLKKRPGQIVLTSSSPKEPSPALRAPSPGGRGGLIIGQHQGLFNYTIGQRQGIDVGGSGPYYVVKKDLRKNILYVTNDPEDKNLLTREVEIHSVNWICGSCQLAAVSCQLKGRFRHQGQLASLTIKKIRNGHYAVKFKKPQKAVASGQSLVLYRGKECMGGGVIA